MACVELAENLSVSGGRNVAQDALREFGDVVVDLDDDGLLVDTVVLRRIADLHEADPRLAAEIIFDQGLGDLFVVRTAGHVVGSEVLGSVEYATSVLGCRLVVVRGHDSCGAVAAARVAVEDGLSVGGFVRDVVERVTPSVLAARTAGLTFASDVDEHIRHTVDLLLDGSHLLSEQVDAGEVAAVGLGYQLAEGSARLVTSRGDITEEDETGS
ncbi:carbonic anhydrase [Streptomyces sp. NPDC006274]|uniref:carbonic anhydrase n=1 Tax=Streptomyces sp. NPDC006274 TaxID=3154582 RepID=UPI0033A3D605